MTVPTCSNCVYWGESVIDKQWIDGKDIDVPVAYCNRGAPSRGREKCSESMVYTHLVNFKQPCTPHNYWCGEHQERIRP